MPALITSIINISVNGEEKEIIITGKHVREFYNKTQQSLFEPAEWIDNVNILLDLINILGIDDELITFEEMGDLKAELYLLQDKIDAMLQKKIQPVMEIRQKQQMENQTAMAEMITSILQKSSIQIASELPPTQDSN